MDKAKEFLGAIPNVIEAFNHLVKGTDAFSLTALALGFVFFTLWFWMYKQEGRGRPMPPFLIPGAMGLAAVCVVGGLLLAWSGGKPSIDIPGPPQTAELQLRFPQTPQAHQLVMWHRLPESFGTYLLDGPQTRPGKHEYVSRLPRFPVKGQRYEGTISRMPDASREGDPQTTVVCFEPGDKTPATRPVVVMECEEGRGCSLAEDSGLARACGQTKASLTSWLPLSSAHAQAAPPSAAPAAPKGWIVPDLNRLREQKHLPNGPAFSEFTVKSAPLPQFEGANRLAYGIVVNGRPVWVNGLPAEANVVNFDPKQGLDIQFGLENLGFSGAQQGREQVDIQLHFFNGQKKMRDELLRMRPVALRDQLAPVAVEGKVLGAYWTAKYVPRSADKYQVFAGSAKTAESAEAAKRTFDNAKFSIASAAGEASRAEPLPLVVVVRPPLERNETYGLAVGIRERSGLVRFSFDEPASTALCARLLELSRESPGVRKDVYRRVIKGGATSRCADL